MAESIKSQVEGLVGSATITSLNDWASDAINKLILLLPYHYLYPFTVIEEVTYSGTYYDVVAKNKRIFEVSRAPSSISLLNRNCDLIIPDELEGQFADSNSMYYPTDYDPKYTIMETPTIYTTAPVITGHIVPGDTSISGTSIEVDTTSIDVYVNGDFAGTTLVSSFGWTLTGVTPLVGGDSIIAYATAPHKEISLPSIPFVITIILVDFYSETHVNNYLSLATGESVGQSFTGNGDSLTSCQFYLGREHTGHPTQLSGTIRAILYAHTGTFGVNGLPTGSPLATSTDVDVWTVHDAGTSISYALLSFTFPTPFTLVAGTHYVITMQFVGISTAYDYAFIGFDAASPPTVVGNFVNYSSGSWRYYTSNAACFYIYGWN